MTTPAIAHQRLLGNSNVTLTWSIQTMIVRPLLLLAVLWGPSVLLDSFCQADSLSQESSSAGEVTDSFPINRSEITFNDDLADFEDFGELSLEQLMKIEVTSVAGVASSLLTTPSAIFVITPDDIQQTGHRNIAELLRIVPGLQVARVTANKWAISSRGFNSLFASKMLVLVDGRSVYVQIFSGVFWEIQNFPLDDIDRIEVIRGPGATLWGENAVNGVINITTKHSSKTQGLMLTGGAGNEYQGFGEFRYGGRINDQATYRLWGAYQNTDSSESLEGGDSPDDWDIFKGGFRHDWTGGGDVAFTLQGDGYSTNKFGEGAHIPVPGHLTHEHRKEDGYRNGGNVLFRASHEDSGDTGWSFQTYYNRFNVRNTGAAKLERDTADFDFRQYFSIGEKHDLIWGLGLRYSRARIDPGSILTFRDLDRETYLFSGFIQDTITLVPDKLSLMLGSKFSHNDFTGFEIHPSARLSWTLDDRQSMWGAVSRAVRTPSRADDGLQLISAFVDTGLAAGGAPSGSFAPLIINGDSSVESEVLHAFEMGYRSQLTDTWSIDVATFYNDYEDLLFAPTPSGTIDNSTKAESYGLEIASTLDLTDDWRINASYTYLQLQMHSRGNVDEAHTEGASPHHQFNIRSHLQLTPALDLNAAAYYVDHVPTYDISSYWRFDLGLTWRPKETSSFRSGDRICLILRTRNSTIPSILIIQHLLNEECTRS